MAKRLIPVVLLAALAALAVWWSSSLFDSKPAGAPTGILASLADPPISGSVADFTVAAPARPAPAVSFSDEAGRALDLNDFAGKLILLNLWATWCGPCLEELPSLDRLQASLGDDRFQVLAVSVDRKGLAAVKPFFDKLAIRHLGLYLDGTGTSLAGFEVQGLPTTILIGPDGTILGMIRKPAAWDSPEALALIGFYRERLFGAP